MNMAQGTGRIEMAKKWHGGGLCVDNCVMAELVAMTATADKTLCFCIFFTPCKSLVIIHLSQY